MTLNAKKYSIFICKITILVTFLINIFPKTSLACSEIWIKNNKNVRTLISARTFDFMTGDGFIMFKPSGISSQAQYTLPGGTPLQWTSKYATLVFKTTSYLDKNLSSDVDGMNEAGLKIGSYFLESATFPSNNANTMIDITSLSQYFLDNFSTVKEALNDIEQNKYSVVALPAKGFDMKLHLYLHDSTGESAILEFINGKVEITKNPAVPVLTNTAYKQSVKSLKNYEEFGGSKYIPGSYGSIDRFVRAAFYRKHFKSPETEDQAVHYGFAAIQTVSVAPRFPIGCTEWTVVSDIINKKMYFRTLNHPNIVSIDLAKLASDQKSNVSQINILRTDFGSDITNLF